MEGLTENKKQINTSDKLKNYKNANVYWPPECSDEILNSAIFQARRLLEELDIDNEGVKIAEKLKKFMDLNYEPHWHVTCGRNFGSYAVHEDRKFMYFYLNKIAFLIYKSG